MSRILGLVAAGLCTLTGTSVLSSDAKADGDQMRTYDECVGTCFDAGYAFAGSVATAWGNVPAWFATSVIPLVRSAYLCAECEVDVRMHNDAVEENRRRAEEARRRLEAETQPQTPPAGSGSDSLGSFIAEPNPDEDNELWEMCFEFGIPRGIATPYIGSAGQQDLTHTLRILGEFGLNTAYFGMEYTASFFAQPQTLDGPPPDRSICFVAQQ